MTLDDFKALVLFCKQQNIESVEMGDVAVTFSKPVHYFPLETPAPLSETEQSRQDAIDDDRLTFMSST